MMTTTEGRADGRAAFLALALLVLIPGLGYAEDSPVSETAADLVILLDASQSVLPYFREATDFVVGPLMRSYLRRGDDFHLLSFGDKAQLEIERRIESEEDLKAALGSLYLVAPLAPGSDLLGALRFLSDYLGRLDQAKPKTVVVITDGLHNPSKSQSQPIAGPAEIGADIEKAAGVFRGKGWTVRIIKLPFGPENRAEAGPENRAEAGPENRAEAGPENRAEAGPQGRPSPAPLSSQAQSQAAPKGVPSPAPLSSQAQSQAAPKGGASLAPPPSQAQSQAAPVPSRPSAGDSGGSAGSGPERQAIPGSPSATPLPPQTALPSGKAAPAPSPALPPSVSGAEEGGPTALGQDSTEEVAEAFVEEAAKALGAELGEFGPGDGPESGLRSLALPELFFPGQLGPRSLRLSFPLEIRNPGAAPIRLELESVLYDSRNVLAKPASISLKPGSTGKLRVPILLPSTLKPGAQALELELGFKDGYRVLNRSGRIAFELIDVAQAPNLLRIPLLVLALLALALALLFAIRRFRRRRKAPLLRALGGGAPARKPSAPPPPRSSTRERRQPEGKKELELPRKAEVPESRPLATYVPHIAARGRTRVELRVAGQNPHIGDRNIHELQAGASKSVGGGRSDFLIFLFRTPRRVAELHYDGERCVFVPLKPEYFPDLEGVLADCIDKEISLLGPHGRILRLRFRYYEAPEVRINRLLHCIEAPGIFRD